MSTLSTCGVMGIQDAFPADTSSATIRERSSSFYETWLESLRTWSVTPLGVVAAAGTCASAPELVTAAVLEDPPLYIREWFDESEAAPVFKNLLEIRERNLGIEGTAIELREINKNLSDGAIVRWAQTVVKADPGIWAAAVGGRMYESWDPDAVLSTATPPVLLMQANPDKGGVLRDVEATRAVDLLSHGRHVKWEDVGHGMHNEQPERFVQLVDAFFGQVLKR